MTGLRQEALRAQISRRVRRLREDRRWTQAELADDLGLSQSRLSEIERGQGSFTAEQFLTILKLFNVSVTHFASERRRPTAELQNALARLGAAQLQESSNVLPSEQLEEVADVAREVLVSTESPRHVTALAAVIVANIDRVNLKRLQTQLVELGFERRLGWVVANTLEAVRRELKHELPRKWALLYRRAEVVLETFLALEQPRRWLKGAVKAPDILDTDIVSTKTLEEVQSTASSISKQWGIATGIQVEDFVHALRGSRVAD
jgi:transcriptional regulator with XRE-family HTH domain